MEYNQLTLQERYYIEIEIKHGKVGIYGDAIHQDCSECGVAHHRSYVEKHFDFDWKVIRSVSKIYILMITAGTFKRKL